MPSTTAPGPSNSSPSSTTPTSVTTIAPIPPIREFKKNVVPKISCFVYIIHSQCCVVMVVSQGGLFLKKRNFLSCIISCHSFEHDCWAYSQMYRLSDCFLPFAAGHSNCASNCASNCNNVCCSGGG